MTDQCGSDIRWGRRWTAAEVVVVVERRDSLKLRVRLLRARLFRAEVTVVGAEVELVKLRWRSESGG